MIFLLIKYKVWVEVNERIINRVFKIVIKPQLIMAIIKFILELLAKGYIREQEINSTVAKYNLPVDKVTKMVDSIIEKQRQGKKIL